MFNRQILKGWVLVSFSVLALISVGDTSLGQVRFEAPINLSDNPTDAWTPKVAAVDNQVVVVWEDDRRLPPLGRGDILLAHSSDQGRTFRTWNLSQDFAIHHGSFPEVVADTKNIYAAWHGQPGIDPRTWAPLLSRSNDGGESFQEPFDLSGRAASGAPILRLQDRTLNVAWQGRDQESGFMDILFAKSTDFGQTFSEPVMVSDISQRPWGFGSAPVLALDGNQVYISWMGKTPGLIYYDIYFARSTEGGKTFSKPVSLSKRGEREIAEIPQLAVGGSGYVYAAWQQGFYERPLPPLADIYFTRSTDGGKTFGETLNLSNNPLAINVGPKMLAVEDNIYIAWQGDSRGPADIYFSRSTDGGQTFSQPQNVSHNPGDSVVQTMAVLPRGTLREPGLTEDVIYLVWQDSSQGGSKIFFSVSLDSGATFSEPERISNNPGYSMVAQIAAAGRSVYVTWASNVAGKWNIFFVRGQLDPDSKTH